MKKETKGNLIVLALIFSISLPAVLMILYRPQGNISHWVVRGAAIIGYIAVFLASLSSVYMRELNRLFGRPFIWGHHLLSITGLVLLTLHPTVLAIETANAAVFVPKFDSWSVFFQLGGRPALYLMYLAVMAGFIRRKWRKNWRTVHQLNYLAFYLGTIHAVLIGTDFSQPILKFIPIGMAIAITFVFIRKRQGQKRRRSRK